MLAFVSSVRSPLTSSSLVATMVQSVEQLPLVQQVEQLPLVQHVVVSDPGTCNLHSLITQPFSLMCSGWSRKRGLCRENPPSITTDPNTVQNSSKNSKLVDLVIRIELTRSILMK